MWERRPGRLLGRFERPREFPANLIFNGDFQVWQRGAGPFTSASDPVNTDAGYFADMWRFLGQSADTCDISQESTVANLPAGGVAAIKLDVETGSNKFGVFQIVENIHCRSVLGGSGIVSLSFKAIRTGTSLDNIRAAVVSWDSTVDTVTADPVSAWNAAGTNPTLVANYTYENTPANLALSTSWRTFTIENIAIDTVNAANIGVFIWLDDTDATVADFLYITDVSLVSGATAISTFVHSRFASILQDCQRYFIQLNFDSGEHVAIGMDDSTTLATMIVPLPTIMRVTPTSTRSSATNWDVRDTSSTQATTQVASSNHSRSAGLFVLTVAAGLTDGEASLWSANAASQWLRFTAEL